MRISFSEIRRFAITRTAPNACDWSDVAEEIEIEPVIEGCTSRVATVDQQDRVASAGARATASVAILPAAPARFSMMNGCHLLLSLFFSGNSENGRCPGGQPIAAAVLRRRVTSCGLPSLRVLPRKIRALQGFRASHRQESLAYGSGSARSWVIFAQIIQVQHRWRPDRWLEMSPSEPRQAVHPNVPLRLEEVCADVLG